MKNFRFIDEFSPIHQLSPFTKMAWVACMMIASLLFEHPLYLTALFIATLPLVLASKIWKQWIWLMFFALFMGIGIVVINAVIINHGSTVLLESTFDIPTLGTPRITLEAIMFAISMSMRLLVIVSSFAIFNFTIHPDDQLLAMIQLRLPYKSVLVTSLSTRFAPLLFEDLNRLSEVQRSRGMEMDKGKLHRRMWNRATLLVPLLANSLDRCVQIAEAMESRAFGQGTGRSYFKRLRLTHFDWITLAIGFIPLAWGIAIMTTGFGNYDAYSNWRISISGMYEYGLLISVIMFSAALVLLGRLKTKVDLD